MLTQKEFVEGCYEWYETNGIIPGDPNEGNWQDAHYPSPRGFGDSSIPLLFNHHQVQGLLQSDEEGRICFFPGDVKTFLDGEGFLCPNWFELYDLYDKWVFEGTKKGGKRTAELGVGIHAPGQQSKGGKRTVELGVGIHAPGKASQGGKKGGKKAAELGVGAHASGKASEGGKKGGKKGVELGVGAHAPGKRSEGGKNTNSQKWICLVTGKISTPGPLTRWQNTRGISTHLRTKLDGSDTVSQTMLMGLAMA